MKQIKFKGMSQADNELFELHISTLDSINKDICRWSFALKNRRFTEAYSLILDAVKELKKALSEVTDDPEPITGPMHKPIISKVPECKNEPIDKAFARIAGIVPLTVAAPEIKELLEYKIKDSISKHYEALVDEYEKVERIKMNPSGFASPEILIKITKQNIITRKWVIEELEMLIKEANNG